MGLYALPGFIWINYSCSWINSFFSHNREVFNYNLFKYFLRPFLFLFGFWDPIVQMLVCLMLSQRSLRLSSFLFIVFCLFCSSAVISTILSSAHLFVLLFQLFFYRFLLVYFPFQLLCCSSLFVLFKFIYLFIYFSLCWVFVAAPGLSLVVASGGYSLLWCAGFSLWWLLLLWSTGSRRAGFSSGGSRAPELRLSSCGA